jgi:hypothetical protein
MYRNPVFFYKIVEFNVQVFLLKKIHNYTKFHTQKKG